MVKDADANLHSEKNVKHDTENTFFPLTIMILQSYLKIPRRLHNVFLEDTIHVCNTSEAMLDCNDWYAFASWQFFK